jgi:quercetin dioxygenase-like cupin family protein
VTISSAATAIAWGDGDAISGTPFQIVVPTANTDGRLSALTATMPPGLVVDEHIHTDEDQITVVISGRVGARVGDREFELGAGGVAFMPRDVPHSQWCVGEEPARIIEIYTPGGFENVFIAAGQAAMGRGGATADDYRAARTIA